MPTATTGVANGVAIGIAHDPMVLSAVGGSVVVPSAAPAAPSLPLGPASLVNSPITASSPVANVSVGSGGATPAQVQQALSATGLTVNGFGIKVGVLSDSFNDLGGAATDEASGALPSAANIQVIKDRVSGGSDEGRAMMQIVHDIAPGASLAFYTAFNSEQDFANGILSLAAAGCKVICDDVSYFDEPFFQNGIIAQAIQTVEAQGVTYMTSAGNEGSNAYQAAWSPIAHTTFNGYSLNDVESFGGSVYQTVTVGGKVPLILEWNQPYGGATSNLEIVAFQNGQLVGTSQSEGLGNPWAGIELTAGTYQIVIENLSGPDPGLIKEITFGDGIPVSISGANVGTVFGHAMTPGVITAAAVSAAFTPAFGTSTPTAESFSSSGAGTELLFANSGTALMTPQLLNPVVVSGIDNIHTTVPGGLSDFYGTSAASASIAGVAALMLSANPNLTPAQVEQIMEQTALPMANSAVSGAGLVQAAAAVAATNLGPVVSAVSITLTQLSVAASSLFTVSDPGGQLVTGYAFEDTGSGHFVLNGVVQPNNHEIDIAAAQLSQLTYVSVAGTTDTIDLRAQDQSGWGNWASFMVLAPALVIQTDAGAFGSTSLANFVGHYFLYAAGGTSGPALSYGGAAVAPGQFGTWSPIGAVQTATGYDIAWKDAVSGNYTIWTTDANGNCLGDPIGVVAGTSYTLESFESIFNQDLNGDNSIGLPTTVIQINGSTSLASVGPYYFLYQGGTGPQLKMGGVAVTEGQFGPWSPIGAVQTASGYDIAWKDASGDYAVWTTDANGNCLGNAIGIVSGNSYALESFETTFNQDLNGDGVVGLKTTVIQIDGSTALTQIADNYFLYHSGSGPELKIAGAAVTEGQFGAWSPFGAVQTASGYDIAWKDGSGDYAVWTTDTNGNCQGSAIGIVSGNSYALESFETIFNQDLNSDGVVGQKRTVIQIDGSTALTQIADNYFLYRSGSGPELKIGGAAITEGQLGAWSPFGAVQTASGYDIAWKDGSGDYAMWTTDADGNFQSNAIGIVSGNSYALESFETTFNQDLNGDGVVGLYAAPGTSMQITQRLSGVSGAATIGAHGTLEIGAADSAAVTFAASTGFLKLDQPSSFTGQIYGFTGNGTLSGSDQIDLKGINVSTAHDSYANGVLTVTDGTHSATLNFQGNYVLANFKLADDGNGGTIVYDPPVPGQSHGGTTPQVSTDTGNDAFVFHPQLGLLAGNKAAGGTPAHNEHAELTGAAFVIAHEVQQQITFGEVPHDVAAIHEAALAHVHQHAHCLI